MESVKTRHVLEKEMQRLKINKKEIQKKKERKEKDKEIDIKVCLIQRRYSC
jgi:hypothetical protein